MANLHAIHEDVPFDFVGSADLAAEFRSAARVLDDQCGQRRSLSREAAEQWRGTYRQQFDQRMGVCITDGYALAAALRRAADGLDRLAAAAKQEQERREWARRWEEQRNKRGFFEKTLDNVVDFFTGEDDAIPEPPPPADPPVFTTAPQVARAR